MQVMSLHLRICGQAKKVNRCHPLLSPTLKISDNLRGPQRLLVTVGMDIKLLESSILRIRRPVLYPLSYGCPIVFLISQTEDRFKADYQNPVPSDRSISAPIAS